MSERNNKLEIKFNKKFGKLSFFRTSKLERRSGNKEIDSFQYNHILYKRLHLTDCSHNFECSGGTKKIYEC